MNNCIVSYYKKKLKLIISDANIKNRENPSNETHLIAGTFDEASGEHGVHDVTVG